MEGMAYGSDHPEKPDAAAQNYGLGKGHVRGSPRDGLLATMANFAARRHLQGDTMDPMNPRTLGQNDLENTNSQFAIGHHGYRLSMLEMEASIKRHQRQVSAFRVAGRLFHMLKRRMRIYREQNRADADTMNDKSDIPGPFGDRGQEQLGRLSAASSRAVKGKAVGQRQISKSAPLPGKQ
eukprot:SAG22_NODE_2280_length_2761_cov_3.172802_1_plen_180_part_00